MKFKNLMPICFILLSAVFLIPNTASTNILESALESKTSIVNIRAVIFDMRKSPKAEARIDPRTGRILVARNIKAAALQQKGAGVIISADGLIVTNLHTIRNANRVDVMLHSKKQLSAQILHLMPEHDLALLKINAGEILTPIDFADSNRVNLGDDIVNIGNSELLKKTLSGGRITGIGRNAGRGNIEIIQTNLNIYKGDSGGPLLNARGQLIGMMTAKSTTKDKTAYAIPSNKIKKLYLEYKENAS